MVVKRRADLDFVRFLAIALAVGWHFNGVDTGLLPIDILLIPGKYLGWTGVDLFFVLSGFLIGGLIFNELSATGEFNAKNFMLRRAFKIWPVLYLYVALLVLTGRYHWWEVVPQTLFHVQNFWPTPANHLWSLAVEEHFYLGMALVILSLTRNGRGGLARLPLVLIPLLFVPPILRFIAYFVADNPTAIQIQTQFRIDALAAGVGLAYLKTAHEAFFGKWIRFKGFWLVMAVFGAASLLAVRDSKLLSVGIGYSLSYLTGAAILLCIYDSRYFDRSNAAVRVCAWIGSYSYPIYVFQFVMLRAGETIAKRLGVDSIPVALDLLLKYGGALVVGFAISKLVERPMLKFSERLLPRGAR